MNNDQNSQFNSVNGGRNASEGTYSYVFATSKGETNSTANPKKGKKKLRIALVLCLCIVISFLSGMGGAFLVGHLRNNGDGAGKKGVNAAPDSDKVFHSNPQSVLTKNTGEASVHGSAGKSVFAPSMVVHVVRDAVVVINVRYESYKGYTQGSRGSGVIISEKGYILTCNHMVEDALSIEVVLNTGEVYAAALVGNDEESDLAVIMIDPGNKPLPYVKQGCSADLIEGERVVAIGNSLDMGLTTTTGSVFATEQILYMRNGSSVPLIPTDVVIDSDNNGGGLFNLDGELIGIVNDKYSNVGEALAYAIPVDYAYEVEKQLIQYGYVRGIVDHGLTLLEVTQSNLYEAYSQYGIQKEGLYVYSSEYSDELKGLDRIVSVNGSSIDSVAAFEALIDTYKVDDTVSLVVKRGDQKVTVSFKLKEYIPDRLKNKAN